MENSYLSIDIINNRTSQLYNDNTIGIFGVVKHMINMNLDNNSLIIYNLVNNLTIDLNKKKNRNYDLLEIADIFNIIYTSNKTIFNLF